MKIKCPTCGVSLNAGSQILGKVVPCPNCGDPVKVSAPAPIPTQPAVAPSPQSKKIPRCFYERYLWWILLIPFVILITMSYLFYKYGENMPPAIYSTTIVLGCIFWISLLVIYFLPTFIAFARKRKQRYAIQLTNTVIMFICLGWFIVSLMHSVVMTFVLAVPIIGGTGLCWLAALIWAHIED